MVHGLVWASGRRLSAQNAWVIACEQRRSVLESAEDLHFHRFRGRPSSPGNETMLTPEMIEAFVRGFASVDGATKLADGHSVLDNSSEINPRRQW